MGRTSTKKHIYPQEQCHSIIQPFKQEVFKSRNVYVLIFYVKSRYEDIIHYRVYVKNWHRKKKAINKS